MLTTDTQKSDLSGLPNTYYGDGMSHFRLPFSHPYAQMAWQKWHNREGRVAYESLSLSELEVKCRSVAVCFMTGYVSCP